MFSFENIWKDDVKAEQQVVQFSFRMLALHQQKFLVFFFIK